MIIEIYSYPIDQCLFVEDTYWKADIVDQQEVLVKIMDTYGKVSDRISILIRARHRQVRPCRMTNGYLTILNGLMLY